MKKLLLAIPLVAGTTWAGASYYVGTSTKDAYTDLLVQLNEFKPFTLVNEQYSAGLATSTAVTNVMASSAPDAKVLFRLQHKIDHSPVGLNDAGVRVGAATIKTTLLLPTSSSNSLLEGFSSGDPVVINTNVKFDGSTTHQLLVSEFQTTKDNANIIFDGVDYTTVVNGKDITGTGTVGAFTLESAMGSLKIAPGNIDVDMEKYSDGLYSGSYGLSFNELSIDSMAIPSGVQIQNINFSSDTAINGTTFDTNGLVSIGNIDSPLPLNSMSVKIGANNLVSEGMSNYVNSMSQFSALADDPASNPDFIKQWITAMMGVLGPKAGVTYDIDLNNDGGNANLKFNAGVIDGSSASYPPSGLTSVATVRDLLTIAEAELDFKADAAALDQTPLAGFLVSPQAEQFVLANGVTYQSLIKVKDLIVDINGNPLSLEVIMGDTLDMPLTSMIGI